MTITGQSTLDKDVINQMVKDAEAHAEDDRKRRDEAEVRNNADSLVYQTEKVLREQGDKVSADERAAVEGPLGDLKKALEGNDIDAIKQATEASDVGQPGVQPEAVRGRRPRRQRRRHVGSGARPVRAPARSTTTTSSTPRSSTRADGMSDECAMTPSRRRRARQRGRGLHRRGAAAACVRRPSAPARSPGDAGSRASVTATSPMSTTPSESSMTLAASIFDVAALIAERDAIKDMAMRVQADFENYRRRMAAQHAADVDRATGRLAEALLPVLDAAEAAYIQHPDEIGPLLNVLLGELRKHGLETLDLEDQPFDPEVADAVAHEPGDGGEVVVAEVLRSGYRWRGKTLRPAMVRTNDRHERPGV